MKKISFVYGAKMLLNKQKTTKIILIICCLFSTIFLQASDNKKNVQCNNGLKTILKIFLLVPAACSFNLSSLWVFYQENRKIETSLVERSFYGSLFFGVGSILCAPIATTVFQWLKNKKKPPLKTFRAGV